MPSNLLSVALAFPDSSEISTKCIIIIRVCFSSYSSIGILNISSGSGSYMLYLNITSLVEPYNGALANFSAAFETIDYDPSSRPGHEKEDSASSRCKLACNIGIS